MAKKKKMPYQRPDGLYEVIRVVNGKRVAFRGRTQKEIEQKMIAYREDAAKGPYFKVAAENWWGEFIEKAAPNSLKGYRPAYVRAVERFGDKRIMDITAKDIRNWLASLIKQDYAKKTIKTHLIIMSQVFKYFSEESSVDHNPAALVRVPSDLPQQKRQLPTDEDDARMMANVLSHPFGMFPFLAKYTGARRGELLALKYSDLDFKEKTIRIERSVYYEGNKPKIKSPKTASGIRTVPMIDIVAAVLPHGKPNHYIFGGEEPYTSSRIDDLWEDYKKVTGVTATPHQWRHLYATLLFDADISAKDAQVLMGHAQFSTTMDIYTHVKDQRIAKSASKLNALEKDAKIG